jgi:hypothetical protein
MRSRFSQSVARQKLIYIYIHSSNVLPPSSGLICGGSGTDSVVKAGYKEHCDETKGSGYGKKLTKLHRVTTQKTTLCEQSQNLYSIIYGFFTVVIFRTVPAGF